MQCHSSACMWKPQTSTFFPECALEVASRGFVDKSDGCSFDWPIVGTGASSLVGRVCFVGGDESKDGSMGERRGSASGEREEMWSQGSCLGSRSTYMPLLLSSRVLSALSQPEGVPSVVGHCVLSTFS